MPLTWSVLAGVTGQKPCCPQFMRIAKLFGLVTGQVDQPCFGFHRYRWLLARARAIVERGQRTFNHRPFNAALNCLMMLAQASTNRKKRRILPISQKNARPLDPARRFSPRLRY